MANIHDIMTADLMATAFDLDAEVSPSEVVAYIAAGFSAKYVLAIVGPIADELADDDDAIHDVAQASLVVLTDATWGIATPAIGDTVVIDMLTWAVAEVLERSHAGGVARLRIVRQARNVQGTPGSRLDTPIPAGALPGSGGR